MNFRFAVVVAVTATIFTIAAKAEPFHIPMSATCGSNTLPALPPMSDQQSNVNYVVSLRYYDRNNDLIAAPIPFMGSGFVSRGNQIRRTDFPVKSGNTLSAVPVCTGFAATTLVEPNSATEAKVHVAVEYAYLSPEIMARRTQSPPFAAAPAPQSVVVDKSILMKTGDVASFDVPGDLAFARLEVAFSTWTP